jgi:hypothetical protein
VTDLTDGGAVLSTSVLTVPHMGMAQSCGGFRLGARNRPIIVDWSMP